MTEALNEVTDGFMIDTQHPPDLRESIRNAAFAAKHLEARRFRRFSLHKARRNTMPQRFQLQQRSRDALIAALPA
ncbi:hypothetical protein FOMG_16781 [Fusarium oxysporum f. sp. melonis 26406]|uniref:Uncharacterized protein n=1 Tax=Fusarium oxysporum f. sp. melonis 26406 TaxID=1089452 RepID=W9ZDI0_FUSOX|nr:hypothetical protein FOMG_16781 [Fusarium oxysporum f. sp. melonis 26406]